MDVLRMRTLPTQSGISAASALRKRTSERIGTEPLFRVHGTTASALWLALGNAEQTKVTDNAQTFCETQPVRQCFKALSMKVNACFQI
jgi:hypothetical protein